MPTVGDLHPSQTQPPEGSAQFQLGSGEQDTAMVAAMKEERQEATPAGGGQGREDSNHHEVAHKGRPVGQAGQDTTELEELQELGFADRERRVHSNRRSLAMGGTGPTESAQVVRQASAGTPNWITDAVLRRQAQRASEAAAATVEADLVPNKRKRCSCPVASPCVCGALNKSYNVAGDGVLGSTTSQVHTGLGYSAHWLSMPTAQSQQGALSGQRQDHDNSQNGNNQYDSSAEDLYGHASRQGQETDEHGDADNCSERNDGDDQETNWLLAKRKGDIVSHPLFPELLSAHVACLRIATPVDQLPTIDAQLAQSHLVISGYQALNIDAPEDNSEKEELEHYMAESVMLLRSFKDQLQQHVRVHAMEAVMACFDIEKQLEDLTGVRVESGQGSGALMSDDEDDILGDDAAYAFDPSLLDGNESGGFGPLIPSETERTLMERVRQELKSELKQGYRAKIIDVREEILRKRRAGKLPGDTTTVLKTWWHAHAKWPYPTEDEKARLVQETGLELKQINNWFINQRKRNWHANPSAASAKTKRKSNDGTADFDIRGFEVHKACI